MGRRATQPIPSHLRAAFYAAAWSIAATGKVTREDGSIRDVAAECGRCRRITRRHGLAVLWATACALRFSELARLRVAAVSESGLSALIERSKGGVDHRVGVARGLIAETMRWRSECSESFLSPLLLPARTGAALSLKAFNRDACGLFRGLFGIELTSHCLRDTACQQAMADTGDIRVAQTLLGHRSVRTTEVYVAKQDARAYQVPLWVPDEGPSPPAPLPTTRGERGEGSLRVFDPERGVA